MSRAGLRVLVLGVNYAPEPTGIAPYTTGMAEGLAKRGHDVHVLTTFPHYPQWAYQGLPPRRAVADRNGVHVQRVRHYVPHRPGTWNRALFEILHGILVSAMPWPAVDVVILVSPALFASRIAAARARVARSRPALGLVVQDVYSSGVREAHSSHSWAQGLMRCAEGSLVHSVDRLAVIHDRFKLQMICKLGVPADKVTVLRNWSHVSPTPNFDVLAFRRRLGWGDDETVVLHAGAMGAKQGLENVVEAAATAQERGLPVRFVLMGDGGQRHRLNEQGRELDQLQFVPPLPDEEFLKALHAADLLLVNERPGVNEMAVPSKLTSYFSAGRPVLAATDAGSTTHAEIMAAGGGVRVDPGVPAALVDRVMRLREDNQVCREMGERGRTYAQTMLAEERALDSYDAWVRALAAARANS